ncbi:YbaB/EbfC family nucleoid-associated protein [Saccharopolyspora erythraea]|uniref:YbaB/EbfC family nucleoid-associated protein n=1 Tax=Saccharopolyspora erythraea TaxID=1836 RepID=UPI002011109C|nr:YbaB/EbfC family nucleoid-associated protein [Saccharopolyspora erythraea]
MGEQGMQGMAIQGSGAAGDGAVEVAVGADGRVERVELAPGFFAGDHETAGELVRDAVNSALDDLKAKLHAAGGSAFDALDAELDKITAGFEKAIGAVADDIAAAQKRIDDLEQ